MGKKPVKTVWVVIPTFNEVENIELLVTSIRGLVMPYTVRVLVVDDNSPDKTWEVAQKLAVKHADVFCMRRLINRGRGCSGVDGFRFALQQGADVLLEMDADFSHDPKFIPALLAGLNNYDLVLGSRKAKGGREDGRPFYRTVITFFANLYIRIVLWLPVKDCNSGFRAFKKQVFDKVCLRRVKARGPNIIQELLFKTHKAGFRIGEIGVVFKERERGTSSLTFKKVLLGYVTVLKLRWLSWRGNL